MDWSLPDLECTEGLGGAGLSSEALQGHASIFGGSIDD